MIIKQCLKFLDASSFCLEDKIMFCARQCHKIAGSVIIFNAIKMMNMPTLWHWFIMGLFPYYNMFLNITIFIGTGMLG